MDDFGLDRTEFSGARLNLLFGSGGRIQQIWQSLDGTEGGESYQFVLSQVPLDEDAVDEYFPGSILIGARTKPDDPWIVSRNSDAEVLESGDDGDHVAFEYEFSLLPEIGATGRYYEKPGPIPELIWDVRIENRGRISIEIGELAFPFALNNVPFLKDLIPIEYADRIRPEPLVVHKSIAGSASYLHAQRADGEGPGLLISCGEETSWEFYHTVQSTLQDRDGWSGIPIVYVHSAATIEREGWQPWATEHTSMVMEPGDVRHYRTSFILCEAGDAEGAMAALAGAGHPVLSPFPGAVAPAHTGIAIHIAGCTPTQVFADVPAVLEAESEDGRGSCLIMPKAPGPLRFSVEDSQGRTSTCNLLFTEPIETLIKRRAEWICEFQVMKAGPLAAAILMSEIDPPLPLTEPRDFSSPFGLTCSLGEALYLAEKNRTYPVDSQIAIVENYLDKFVSKHIQNPSNGSVAFRLEENVANFTDTGNPGVYAILATLYATMATLSEEYGTKKSRAHYVTKAKLTAKALLRFADPSQIYAEDLPMLTEVRNLLRPLIDRVQDFSVDQQDLLAYILNGPEWPAEPPFIAQEIQQREDMSQRSYSPHWWWFGSDQRRLGINQRNRAMLDQGELCLGPTTSARAEKLAHLLSHDARYFPRGTIRLLLGGLIGVWSLVRPDGAAAAGFCPDAASEQFGMSAVTGDASLALFHYLRHTGAYMLPIAETSFGAFVTDSENQLTIKPWDGVGRRIQIRGYGIEAEAIRGRIIELRMDKDRGGIFLRVENPSHLPKMIKVRLFGLWGSKATVNGTRVSLQDGNLMVEVLAGPFEEVVADIKGVV